MTLQRKKKLYLASGYLPSDGTANRVAIHESNETSSITCLSFNQHPNIIQHPNLSCFHEGTSTNTVMTSKGNHGVSKRDRCAKQLGSHPSSAIPGWKHGARHHNILKKILTSDTSHAYMQNPLL